MVTFADRQEAGDQLASHLQSEGVTADVVLGIPRGGLPVARPVADALDAELDVVVAKKLPAPTNPELAIGAVASDGSLWRNDDLIDRLGVDESYVDSERDRQAEAAREKRDRYRKGEGGADLDGHRALLVDDGVATGATAIACLRQARDLGASHVALAIPVAPPETVEMLRLEADAVHVLDTPSNFGAVGRYYRDFTQVSDEEAMTYLE